MSDATSQQLALGALEQVPEDAPLEDAVERLAQPERVEHGRTHVRAGRTVSLEDVGARLGGRR